MISVHWTRIYLTSALHCQRVRFTLCSGTGTMPRHCLCPKLDFSAWAMCWPPVQGRISPQVGSTLRDDSLMSCWWSMFISAQWLEEQILSRDVFFCLSAWGAPLLFCSIKVLDGTYHCSISTATPRFCRPRSALSDTRAARLLSDYTMTCPLVIWPQNLIPKRNLWWDLIAVYKYVHQRSF